MFYLVTLLFLVIISSTFPELLRYPLQKEIKTVAKQAHLRNRGNSYYTAKMVIGDTPKAFNFTISTGHSDFWVMGTECWYGSYCGDPFKTKFSMGRYNNIRLRKKRISFLYDSLTVHAIRATYTVRFAEKNITNQEIGLVYAAITKDTTGEKNDYNLPYMDGYLGLGLQKISVLKKPLLYNMYDQRIIDKKIFSIKLNMLPTLVFGIDQTLYKGYITYVDIISDEGYIIKVNGLKVDGEIWATDFKALVDTSTSILLTPVSIYNQFVRKYDNVNCTEVADLTFVIGGKEFIVPKNYYLYEHGDICYTEIAPYHDEWVLGLPFLNTVYTIFDIDNMKIGFAETYDL